MRNLFSKDKGSIGSAGIITFCFVKKEGESHPIKVEWTTCNPMEILYLQDKSVSTNHPSSFPYRTGWPLLSLGANLVLLSICISYLGELVFYIGQVRSSRDSGSCFRDLRSRAIARKKSHSFNFLSERFFSANRFIRSCAFSFEEL